MKCLFGGSVGATEDVVLALIAIFWAIFAVMAYRTLHHDCHAAGALRQVLSEVDAVPLASTAHRHEALCGVMARDCG